MNKRVLCAAIFLIASLHAADVVQPGDVASAKPKEVKRAANGAVYWLLENGCEIIAMEKHTAPVATIQAWVRTGAIDEGRFLGAGLSHFCEHLLFKGTTKRPTGVLDQEIRGAGGDDNAYTSSDRTVYHITTAATGFETSFNVLADMIMDSTFPPAEVVKEHAVVYKEIERFLDNPDGILYESFEQTVYQVHPYRVPVLGYPERFKEVTRDEVYAYYKERYAPQMCTFVVVGDFNAGEVLVKMAKTLSAWRRTSVAPQFVAEEPKQVAPRSVTVYHPLTQVPKIISGFPGVSLRHPDLYALDLLASVLGDGRASRLYREVKDKQGLALEVSAFDYTPFYPGYFGVTASVEPDKLKALQEAVAKVLADVRTQPPTEEELARAKRKVYTQHVFSQMTVDGMAASLGADWFDAGDLDFQDHYTERMQLVSAEDVLRAAKKYLDPEKLSTAILLPGNSPEKNTAPAGQNHDAKATEAQLAGELQQLKAAPEVESASRLEGKAVFEIKLKNGVRLVVREDHALPVVNIAIAALGGTRWEPAEKAGAGHLLASMLDRGTEKMTKLQIAAAAEDLGASLAPFSVKNSFGVGISGLQKDMPRLMELAADSMLHANFPQEELEKLKADTIQQIAMEDEDLVTIATKQLRPLLYGNHPYARQTMGTQETVRKVSADDVKTLHKDWVQAQNLSVGFVGDVSALVALGMANEYFGKLVPGNYKPPEVPPVPLPESKTAEAAKPDINGAMLMLGYRGVGLKDPDREPLDVIAGILSGLGGRLGIALREKQGLAYSVGVYNDSQLDGGAIVFYIQTDPKGLALSEEGMRKEAERLRNEPVPEKELESIRSYLAGSEAIELQDQSALAQRLALSQLYEEGAAHVFDRRERLDKVDAAQVQKAAQKFLDPQHWAKAVVKPK